ncbi:MAG TPA: hypothetical protein VHZ26_13920 [Caulobacteraceae bacterium]|jgi:hypothetical protein|nr:hypothetical protein [Caulobacteraceae bacterium]
MLPAQAFADPPPATPAPSLTDTVASTLANGCLQSSDPVKVATLFTRSGWPAFRNQKGPSTPVDVTFFAASNRDVGGKTLILALVANPLRMEDHKVGWMQCDLADAGGRQTEIAAGVAQVLGDPPPPAADRSLRWTFRVNGKTRTPIVLAPADTPKQIADRLRAFEPDERLIDVRVGTLGTQSYLLVSTYGSSAQ